MSRKRIAAASRAASAGKRGDKPRLSTPVPVRPRHDGWTPEKQVDFIEALAESGCVAHACQRVGMQPQSAYTLRRRVDAQSFRVAWDLALDYAVQRLAEAALSRAIHGVAVPVFFQGEQIGERRYFDERLTRFILGRRDPVRYGAWIDRVEEARRHPDGAARQLSYAIQNLEGDAYADEAGEPRPRDRLPISWAFVVDAGEERAADAERREAAREAAEDARREVEFQARLEQIARGEEPGKGGPP